MLSRALAIAVLFAVIVSATAPAARRPDTQRSRSIYLSLTADREVAQSGPLLTTTVVLARPDWIFVETDGSYAPSGPAAAADVYIAVDGMKVTNDSALDWRGSLAPREHSFNAVGALRLPRGAHAVTLVATPVAVSADSFAVRAGANLSVLVHPAARVIESSLQKVSTNFDFHTRAINNNAPALPHVPLLAATTGRAHKVIALGSASDLPGSPDSAGDAMLGLYLDGRYPGSDRTTWSVNDHWVGAELAAPLFVQGRFALHGAHSVSLDASEFPWNDEQGENPARYRIDSGARLVSLLGGMSVIGSALTVRPWTNASPWNFIGVGTSVALPGVPNVGTDVLLAQSEFVVPKRDSGVVMFTAKSRVQGDTADEGGRVSLWLTLDGRRVGSTGSQLLGPQPFAISERSICASYMSAGRLSLSNQGDTRSDCTAASTAASFISQWWPIFPSSGSTEAVQRTSLSFRQRAMEGAGLEPERAGDATGTCVRNTPASGDCGA